MVVIGVMAASGCGATGQSPVDYPVSAAGEAPAPFAAGAWQVTLERAEVGLGPVYFCATSGASSDLCPAAVQELAGTGTIDALDPTPRPLGRITGVTGEVRSATWDYAVTWLATEPRPTPKPGAPGGRSARFEGRATDGTRSLRFVAELDVVSRIQGERAVLGARAEQRMDEPPPEGFGLLVRVSPSAWWRGVDFEELAALSPAGGGPVVVPEGSRAASAIIVGMTAGARPAFEWGGP